MSRTKVKDITMNITWNIPETFSGEITKDELDLEWNEWIRDEFYNRLNERLKGLNFND